MSAWLLAAVLARADTPPAPPPLPRDGRVSVPLPALLAAQPPRLDGGGALGRCVGEPVGLDAAMDGLEAAERALAYAQHDDALRALVQAEAALACVQGPIAANVASRAPFLRGIVAFQRGDLATARLAFRDAHGLRPGLPWDDDFSPDAQVVSDLARAELVTLARATVRIVPPADVVWLDGHLAADPRAPLSLTPGRHYLQLPATGWTPLVIDVPAGASSHTLLVPALAGPDTLAWLEEPAHAADLAALLGLALPSGTSVLADVRGRSFASRVGDSAWETVDLTPPPRHRGARVVTGVGGAAIVSGFALVIAGQAGARRAVEDGAAADTLADWRALEGAYETGRTLNRVGLAMLGGGVVVGGGAGAWIWWSDR